MSRWCSKVEDLVFRSSLDGRHEVIVTGRTKAGPTVTAHASLDPVAATYEILWHGGEVVDVDERFVLAKDLVERVTAYMPSGTSIR